MPSVSKILEKIVSDQLYFYFETNDLIDDCQFAFRRGRSTEMALIGFISKILIKQESGLNTIAIFLDLAKAFDTVAHDVLLGKLEHYGIGGTALRWFESYLTDRNICVKFEESISSLKEIKCSVPQGSSLGPLLFIIYVNDITKTSNILKYSIYADDTVIYTSGKNYNTLINNLNDELVNLYYWFLSNKLTLNINKTHCMVFDRGKRLPQDIPLIRFNDKKIDRITETRFLGLTITDKLNWRKHIKDISLKVNKLNGIIYLTRQYFGSDTLRQMYTTLIYPHLIYCNILWGYGYHSHLNPLILAQKRVIRTITFSRKYTHTSPLFTQLNLLKLQDINILSNSIFVYKIINNIIFTVVNYTFAYNIHRIVLRDHLHLRVPFGRSTQYQQSVVCRSCRVWNDLPINIRMSPNLIVFKRSVREFLLHIESGNVKLCNQWLLDFD